MKRFQSILLTALAILMMSSVAVADDMARFQIIHNAADPAAAEVDIYVNGDLFLNDFAFRAATPFVDVPAGVELVVGVAPGTSMSADDVIAEFPLILKANRSYYAIANGVLGNDFAMNPDGMDIGFTVFAKDWARESSRYSRYVEVIAFHGATDAPAVDIWRQDRKHWPLYGDLSYGEFSRYKFLGDKEYVLNITPAGQPETVVASFTADLNGLAGGAAVVFASGFLNPAANNDGPAFGLFVALPTGDVVELPSANQTARLQVIHNAADPAASEVDVYLNGDLLLNDFAFRAATPFIDAPAGVTFTVGIAPGNSTSSNDVIAVFPFTLQPNQTYVAVANGVLGDGFAENPDGADIGFTVFARDGIRESTPLPWFTKLIAFHGATDAPAVDVVVNTRWGKKVLFGDLAYGQFSDYGWVLPAKYTLDITPAGDNETVVASFEANLSGLGGGAAVVFASGFLSPDNNNDGPAFGLFAALPDGTVVELPAVETDAAPERAKMPQSALAELPDEFSLNQNYPNPFNPTTIISYTLPTASNVQLTVYNLLGQEVDVLVDGFRDAGYQEVEFDAGNLSTGVYFYRLSADNYNETRKMMLIK